MLSAVRAICGMQCYALRHATAACGSFARWRFGDLHRASLKSQDFRGRRNHQAGKQLSAFHEFSGMTAPLTVVTG